MNKESQAIVEAVTSTIIAVFDNRFDRLEKKLDGHIKDTEEGFAIMGDHFQRLEKKLSGHFALVSSD